ncbi:unnamed protein product [Vitrella brassicaformis CCMP3155]|uniref:Sodium/hydrogen exchanger n=3 Tax=Vitrella brassicaformis TaxID=1169539 RepID=A0A0G4F5I9_VITBC|nr:unnamed protein product [Vitrella brassicaformis CCMP3155]|eukprot:CEM07750.1 unnamed protein product [Vitrella brassicaformis CCMP3155]
MSEGTEEIAKSTSVVDAMAAVVSDLLGSEDHTGLFQMGGQREEDAAPENRREDAENEEPETDTADAGEGDEDSGEDKPPEDQEEQQEEADADAAASNATDATNTTTAAAAAQPQPTLPPNVASVVSQTLGQLNETLSTNATWSVLQHLNDSTAPLMNDAGLAYLNTTLGMGVPPVIVVIKALDPPAWATATPTTPPKSVDEDTPPPLELLKSEEKEVVVSTGLLLLLIILVVSLFGAHVLKKLKVKWLQLPVWATFLGLITGAMLKYVYKQETILENILAFNDDVFFILLLPPIIFESGFSMSGNRARLFFKHFGAILWFALFATLMSFVWVGAMMFFSGQIGICKALTLQESFAFGALISSTDPVSVLAIFKEMNADAVLYTLIFGESLLNDAIAIVLYRTIVSESSTDIWRATVSFLVVFASSFVIGVAVGLISALTYKYMDLHKVENQVLEASLLLIFPWIAYLVADGFGHSGIVAILFCGIVMAHYTYPNLSDSAQNLGHSVFSALALLAESVVFVFLGLAVWSFNQTWDVPMLLVCTLLYVTMGRIISVYATAFFVNLFRTSTKIPRNFQHIMVIGGLRGAIAFALSLRARHDFKEEGGPALLTITLFYALFTIVGIGSVSVPIFEKLDVFEKESCAYELIRPTTESLTSGQCGCLKRAIFRVDREFMRKIFTNAPTGRGSVSRGPSPSSSFHINSGRGGRGSFVEMETSPSHRSYDPRQADARLSVHPVISPPPGISPEMVGRRTPKDDHVDLERLPDAAPYSDSDGPPRQHRSSMRPSGRMLHYVEPSAAAPAAVGGKKGPVAPQPPSHNLLDLSSNPLSRGHAMNGTVGLNGEPSTLTRQPAGPSGSSESSGREADEEMSPSSDMNNEMSQDSGGQGETGRSAI